MVTLLAWIAHRLVSSKRWTRKASAASCRASIAWDCQSMCSSCGRKLRAIFRTYNISIERSIVYWGHTRRENGSFWSRSSVDPWYLLISRRALVPESGRFFLLRSRRSLAKLTISISFCIRDCGAYNYACLLRLMAPRPSAVKLFAPFGAIVYLASLPFFLVESGKPNMKS